MPTDPLLAPRRVLLFSGHMTDAPGRAAPRFPSGKVPAARQRIEAVLATLGAGATDLAFSQAAAGGDLLFLAACVARGVRCQVLLPQPEPAFLADSVLPSSDGPQWLARWQALRPHLGAEPQVLPAVSGADLYERCNASLLSSATAAAARPDHLHLLLLWDGGGGDGPGGTHHMMRLAEAQGAQVHWIDTRSL